MRCEPRLLADQHDVGVDELPAAFLHLSPRLAQELDRVRSLVLRIAGREERADVRHAGRAEDRVRQRVCKHVAVGMARQPTRVIDANAAEHERNAVHEGVRVEAGADTELAHPSGSCLRTRASNTLTVSRPFACANATATSKSSPTSGGSCASDASVTGAEERLSSRASG